MKIIGLTGGIGSGKSTVAEIFAQLGVPVYEADAAARKLQETDETLKSAIRKAFGDDVFDASRQLDRKKMAALVFSSPAKLAELNALVHPAVAADFRKWIALQHKAAYVIRVAAILFESGSDKDCDAVIAVTAPDEIRISRVMQRDHVSREQVIDRIKRQMTEEERLARSGYRIINDGKTLLLPQVIHLHEKFSA